MCVCRQACSDRTYMDFTNVTDLSSQWFYRALEATWYWQMVARFLITQVGNHSNSVLACAVTATPILLAINNSNQAAHDACVLSIVFVM